MAKERLMVTMADFQKLGINPDKMEIWEDGIRQSVYLGTERSQQT